MNRVPTCPINTFLGIIPDCSSELQVFTNNSKFIISNSSTIDELRDSMNSYSSLAEWAAGTGGQVVTSSDPDCGLCKPNDVDRISDFLGYLLSNESGQYAAVDSWPSNMGPGDTFICETCCSFIPLESNCNGDCSWTTATECNPSQDLSVRDCKFSFTGSLLDADDCYGNCSAEIAGYTHIANNPNVSLGSSSIF